MDVTELGFVALVSFGSVGLVSFFLKDKPWFDSRAKAVLLVGFAFVYGFVPAEFSNQIADRLKDAVAIGASATAVYGGGKGLISKFGSK
ncbi:hypothetical protein LCGC14_1408460 [marine sediment metagenome]|uniref:Holin n=1 Tax=marine sediment metagenome TaxID=412755 RepID=A0A0F9KFW2_9ZZZZ